MFRSLRSLSFLALLAGCDMPGYNGVAATTDPASCTAPGLTTLDGMGRVYLSDGVIAGQKAVKACDPTSPKGYRVWLVGRIHEGQEVNGQNGLLVDDHGNALTAQSLQGLTSQKTVTVPETHFTASCDPVVSCGKVKAEPAATSASTITMTVPAGMDVKVVSGK